MAGGVGPSSPFVASGEGPHCHLSVVVWGLICHWCMVV